MILGEGPSVGERYGAKNRGESTPNLIPLHSLNYVIIKRNNENVGLLLDFSRKGNVHVLRKNLVFTPRIFSILSPLHRQTGLLLFIQKMANQYELLYYICIAMKYFKIFCSDM